MGGRNQPIPVSRNKKHFTKEEKRIRLENEEKLKGSFSHFEPPEYLNELAKVEWYRVVKELHEVELINNFDVYCLAGYCDMLSRYLEVSTILSEEGISICGKEHPLVKTHIRYTEILKKMASEFGLSPVSRCKLTIPKVEKKSSFEVEFG